MASEEVVEVDVSNAAWSKVDFMSCIRLLRSTMASFIASSSHCRSASAIAWGGACSDDVPS